ncbi:hypothetical protein VPH35_000258 [Triticum aestivum]
MVFAKASLALLAMREATCSAMVGVPPVRRTAPLLQPPCLHPQGGDCAKSFKEFKANNIHGTFRVLLQMGDVLVFGGQVPIVKVGRMAGQFAKPRSGNFEEKDGVKLPSYRRNNIKGDAFDLKGRVCPR